MGEIINQLKSQNLDDVLPTSFKQVGGVVFPDARALPDLGDLSEIVKAWGATHAPAGGNPIPSTGASYSASPVATDTAVDLVAPAATEVVVVTAISTDNAGVAPIIGFVSIGGAAALSFTASPATNDEPMQLQFPYSVAKGAVMQVTVTSGTATDLTVNAAGLKSVI